VKHGCALSRGGVIQVDQLPEEVTGAAVAPEAADEPRTLAEVEREHVLRVLARVGGSQQEAARLLGVGRTTLWRKLKGWGIAPEAEA
jgi:two-component system response regulator HydG